MKTISLFAATAVVASHACAALSPSHGDLYVPSHVARVAKGVQVPESPPAPKIFKSQGCYSSGGNMTLQKDYVPEFGLASGKCNEHCRSKKNWIMGLRGDACYCGFALPPVNEKSKDSNCNYPCPGYDIEACGGLGTPGYWSVWNTGINIEAPVYDGSASSSSSSSSPSSTSPPSQSSGPATPSETDSPAESEKPEEKKSTNVAGIAAGVVVGVVALAGLAGAAVFLMRRRRNAEIEEEHRRNAAVNAFINGSKPPSTNGSISMTDSRLDPVMAHRRLSDGSIADNEDYSRRILRVCG